MKSPSVLIGLFSASLLVVGCSTPTEITTKDGQTVVSPDKPKVKNKDDFITYTKDGKEVQLNKDEVSKIEEVN